MKRWATVLIAVLLAVPAAAGSGDGDPAETGVQGKVASKGDTLFDDSSLGDAVVYLEKLEGAAPSAGRAELAQKNKAFDPGMLIIQTGTTVRFPNRDKLYHNVFSLTAGSEFDLGLYAQGSAKSVTFSKSGVVEVFCNIHPDMVASILVLQNPHHVRVSDDGSFRLPLPPGKHTIVAWWPKGPRVKREVEVTEGKMIDLSFELEDSGSVRHLDKNGQPYGRYK